MLEDIHQTPEALKNLLNSHIDETNRVFGINLPAIPSDTDNIYIIASGSSRNAALMAKYFIEKIAKIPIIVDYSGEFAHRGFIINKKDLFITISQSGETADVISAIKRAGKVASFAITNNPDSQINKLSRSGMFVHAGKEAAIPATKSYTCQIMSLYLLGLSLAQSRNSLSGKQISSIVETLKRVPDVIAANMQLLHEQTVECAKKLKDYNNLLIIGRGQNYALAEECSLKIQETSYINAFGYPTGEFMHGHLAVCDENNPVLSIITRAFDNSESYELALNNTREIKQKRNPFMAAIGHNSAHGKDFADVFVEVPEMGEITTPFLTMIAIQLLTYQMAALLGRDTLHPRGLTKTVLSE
ncbi:MAG: SIS domain-containing protein [Candidatus Gastranaerophilales bacterium]|nr:SIS domain-containing protein [Candidatus Gastranaerophilales bacterium]